MKLDAKWLSAWVSFLMLLWLTAFAQEEAPKTFFLPKNPTAAAYILNRLSNKELIAAPRSEFVYVALLQRKGLERKYRVEALEGLGKIRKTDALTELLGGIGELDRKGEDFEPVLRELAGLLLQNRSADLQPKRPLLAKLAAESQMALARQIGYAGLMTADGVADKAWAQAASEPVRLGDLVTSIPLLRDTGLRGALYPKVEPLLRKAEPAELQRAAITAMPAFAGHELETFTSLAALVKAGTERTVAVASLQRIPRKNWPKDQAESLSESLVSWLQTVPVEQRTEPEVLAAFQFATDLAGLLPPEKSKAVSKLLRGIGVSVVVVRTIPEQMLYDKSLIVVEVGKPVEIILVNDDAMPHNLVVVAPGAVEEIGQAAEKMGTEPDAQGRTNIPDSPKVLHATKMVEPGQQAKLSFTAPEEPGNYQYVCTFPGHWRRMVGTLAVVKDVEAFLASAAANPQPVMTEWTVASLAPDLAKSGVGRSLENGRDFFTKLACSQCHKLGKEGNSYGPDLSDVFARYKNDRAEVLRQILEPSLVISNRYINYQFELKNGDSILGLIVKEDADDLMVQTGPSDALIQTIKKSEIKERQPQSSSPMPIGLLSSLSKEQILDLLAYLESGGKMPTHEHGH
jgi:putative heme-binding domain-containing protein